MKTLLTYRKPIVALFAIVFALTLHGVSSTQAYTHIYVDAVSGTNAPTGKGSASSPYQSITYALLISARNNLADPWHVHIHPGSYNGDPAKGNAREIFPLKLRQEMIFEGTTTAAECIIDGQHTGAANVPILLGENTEGVTIRNLTIQNSLRTSGTGGIVLHDPTGTKETPSTFEGCIIHNNKGGGLWSNMPLILTGNTFSNNHGAGVWSSKSTAAMNNTFSANVGNGLYIEGNSTGGISENVFENNSESGVHVKNTLENNVTQNTFSNNAKEGISVEGHIGEGFVGDITHNTFTGNKWGGFDIRGFTGNVAHNTFDSNHGNGGGGGFRIIGNFTGGNVIHNVFIGNIVVGDGGAGFLITGNFTGNVAHNTFDGNQHKGSWHANGGGFCVKGTFTGEITDNRFTRNMIYSFGGAFFVQALTRKISRNIFDGNSAESGGAFELGMSTNTVEVFNNIFFNSTASITGNSVVTKHATHFMNNLFMISDELSEGVSSAHTIWVSSPECRFHNNIFSGVKTAIYTQGTFDLPITHNLFHNVKIDFVEQAGNNLGNDLLFWELVAVNATNNLEGDPQLVDPVTSRDFHLQATSPAINAGTNAFAPADDLDGVTRPVGATVDIGPYEYGGTPVVTTQDPPVGGTITVRASTDDISAPVEFTITTGAASTTTRTPGAGVTPVTISPVVHVAAASRPPMLWVDGGAIYALVGASPQRFASSVDNALNITVAGGKVYWTEKTGESAGTINSANLNGSSVTQLASIMAVPMGIAVDTARSKLFWTNARGRIQSANLDGSGITNVMLDLPSPMDIALAGGNAYWTQGNGSVRFVNLNGQKVVRNIIPTGTDTPGSLVIGGGKVYWTEMTGESGGTVNSANLNGTGATQLASILAAPIGIAVDGARSKLYWTNARGRIQSANLDGSGITNVVDGLGSPGDMVLSNSIAAPAATPTTPTPTTASNKYDVNGDGSVNNADSDAITVAIAAGATDAKYDVNGDGTVNVFDLVEIIANRDPGAAGAPTLFGMKMSAVQIDSLQEQIDLLIATNDRSPAALRTLIYLQQLLVTARPEKTQLLANYPNPFNPETWIPYELATDTHVRLMIYNTQGVVIRTLQFGHQSAGYYVDRDRAAYWDGRNALGEQVASGLYFYQLETDEMSLMRKMVILK